jgi:hypothetical protein
MAQIIDEPDYADQIAGYILEQLDDHSVELHEADREQMQSIMVRGLEVARNTGGEHWELAFRGSIDVMLERMLFVSNPEQFPLPPHPPGSELADQEAQMMRQLSTMQIGGPISMFNICPLWPFC